MKLGIIGFGKMGRIRYDAIKAMGGHSIRSICDVAGRRLPEHAAEPLCADYREVLDDKEIAAVFVCTPNYLTKPVIIEALMKGKHVFSEKPPGMNLAETKAIIRAERARPGLKLMFGFNHRHHDSMLLAKKLITSGRYGRVLWMRGRYGKGVSKDFAKSWRARKRTAGGGIFLDQGIHMLDLFLMFCGDFEEVKAFVSHNYWKLDVEDNVFLILRNKAGQMASLHSTMTQWRHIFSLEIFLEKGYITVNGLKTPSGAYGRENMSIALNRTPPPTATWTKEEELFFDVDQSWRREVSMFISAIRNDSPVSVGGTEDALKLMRIVDKVYRGR